MNYNEKINLYVPRDIGQKLLNDASLFEIFKKDKRTINKNRFLSLLLCNYYSKYLMEKQEYYKIIKESLSSLDIPDDKPNQIAQYIVDNTFTPTMPRRKGRNPICFSLKPTKETQPIIKKIENNLTETDYISQYICKMLVKYCDKPINERERIIFADNFEKIESACKNKNTISFSLIWDEKRENHEVFPYAIVPGKEEMFNYLICVELNHETQKEVVKSYRLCRITDLGEGNSQRIISDEIEKLCELTKEKGPQYAINTTDRICVRLSDRGQILYNRIYFGRPPFSKIENHEHYHDYYFDCSVDQVFNYFRKFEGDTAIILSPESLRNKMYIFHRDVSIFYEQHGEEY